MHALHDRPLPARRIRRPAEAHLVLPVARHAAVLPRRHDRSRPGPLLRGVRDDAACARRPARDRRRVAAGPPRLLLPRCVGRLHVELHRPRPVLPRGHRRNAAHLRSQPDPRVPGRRVGVGATGRWSRCRRVEPDDTDRTIAAFVAERIPNGATIQTGIGAIPNAIMASLADHRDLGVHTELLSDGVVDLIEAGVVNGVRKRPQPHQDGRHLRARHRATERLPPREHRHRAARRCAT